MAVDTIAPETRMIYDLVCSVNTLTTPQIAKILENTVHDPQKVVKVLCMMRYTKWIDEMYTIPFSSKAVDNDAIDCVWVMLDLLSTKEGLKMDYISQVIRGNDIVKFTYIQSDKNIVSVIHVNDNELSKIPASRQRFYDITGRAPGEEKDANVVYMYVTTSKKVVESIKNADLKFPHKVALLSGDLTSGPVINYY